jgi:hypothetical protein
MKRGLIVSLVVGSCLGGVMAPLPRRHRCAAVPLKPGSYSRLTLAGLGTRLPTATAMAYRASLRRPRAAGSSRSSTTVPTAQVLDHGEPRVDGTASTDRHPVRPRLPPAPICRSRALSFCAAHQAGGVCPVRAF